jgi:uncharacterized membrane protein
MKKAIIIMTILTVGFILFLMSLSTSINTNIISFVNSIPFIGRFFTTMIEFVVSSWWHYVPLKPVFILLGVITSICITIGLDRIFSKLKVTKNKYTAAKKTMAHMVIKIDDISPASRNSAMNKVISDEQLYSQKTKEGVK